MKQLIMPNATWRLLLLLLLEHLLDNLLLLDQEGAHDPLADACGAAGATVGTGHPLLVLGNASVLHGAHAGKPLESHAAVSALDLGGVLGNLVEGKHATGGLHLANLVRLGGVRVTAAVGKALDHGDYEMRAMLPC